MSYISNCVRNRQARLSALLICQFISSLLFCRAAEAGFWDFLQPKPEPPAVAPVKTPAGSKPTRPASSPKPEWTASPREVEEVAARLLVNSRRGGFSDPCRSMSGSVLLVTLQNQTLYMCNDGRNENSFAISIGAAGAGKTTNGDGKTPVGIYDVHVYQSPGYGEVLYVEYPNAEQIAKGYRDANGQQRKYSGSQILIHGPSLDMKRDLSVLEQYLSAKLGTAGKGLFETASSRLRSEGLESVNWTAGCIALSSRGNLQDVVRFASLPERRDLKVVILQ